MKKVENEILHHRTGVPGGCRYFSCYCMFKNVKVWTKSFQTVPIGVPYDKISLLWPLPKFDDFQQKSSFFGFLKIFMKNHDFRPNFGNIVLSGFLS